MKPGGLSGLTLAAGVVSVAVVVLGPLPYWSPLLLGRPVLGLGSSGPLTAAALVGWGVTGLLGVGGGAFTLMGATPVLVLAVQGDRPDWRAVGWAIAGGMLGGLAAVGGLVSAVYAGTFLAMGAVVWAAGGA